MSRTVEGVIRAREVQPSSVHRSSRNYQAMRYAELVPDEED